MYAQTQGHTYQANHEYAYSKKYVAEIPRWQTLSSSSKNEETGIYKEVC